MRLPTRKPTIVQNDRNRRRECVPSSTLVGLSVFDPTPGVMGAHVDGMVKLTASSGLAQYPPAISWVSN